MMDYQKNLARVLDAMGGLYLVEDLKTAIAEDRMQGFSIGNSWAITQVYPVPARQAPADHRRGRRHGGHGSVARPHPRIRIDINVASLRPSAGRVGCRRRASTAGG